MCFSSAVSPSTTLVVSSSVSVVIAVFFVIAFLMFVLFLLRQRKGSFSIPQTGDFKVCVYSGCMSVILSTHLI